MPDTYVRQGVRLRLLRVFDRLFPREPSAGMTATQQTAREEQKAASSMGEYLGVLGRADVDILDFGCGWGGETLWLADRVRSVVGTDVNPLAIAQAQATLDARPRRNCQFVLSTQGRIPVLDQSFDAVFSTDTFEHVMDLNLAFSEIFRVLRPSGQVITRFGPLFYSPFGYHLRWACQVPYAHLIFGLPAVLALRNERAAEALPASTWRETGVNGARFVEFAMAARDAGFEFIRFDRVPVLRLTALAGLPIVGDLLTFGVYCHLRRPPA